MKRNLLLVLLLSAALTGFSQKAGAGATMMDSITAIQYSDLLYPVRFTGWDQPNVAAITLSIQIQDTNVIGFRGLQDFNPAFSGLNASSTNYLPATQNILVAWSSLNPPTLNSGVLFNIKLRYKGGFSDVIFKTQLGLCEIADLNGDVYTINWTPGQICEDLSSSNSKTQNSEALSVSPNPASQDVCFSYKTTDNCEFTITIINAVGDVVLVKTFEGVHTGNDKQQISVRDLQNGLYYYVYEIQSDIGTVRKVGKLIVSH